MAFSATYIEITLRYLLLGQQCQTARAYSWDGAAIATATAEALGESWWNHYKNAWRALAPDYLPYAQFTSVLVREVGGSLSYGEYAIPIAEQDGTRSTDPSPNMMPSYVAVGCRLAVGSRLTKPGQMRIPFLYESDNVSNTVEAGFLALCEDLAELYSSSNTLGAPTATGVISPAVVRYGEDPDTVVAGQPIIGFVLNPFTTSQVSRRYGHGS